MNEIKLLWVHTNFGAVTIRPNPKSPPDIKLFYVGSSGSSVLSGEQRKNPITSLVVEFTAPQNPQNGISSKDLIVVETLSGDKRSSHLLELTWSRDGSSRINLNHTWINVPGRMIQSFIGKDGRTGLTVVVSGKVYTTHADQAGSSKTDVDVICRYAVGRISVHQFLEEAGKSTSFPVGTNQWQANRADIAARQLAHTLVQVLNIVSEPVGANPFKSRIRRIRKIFKEILNVQNNLSPLHDYIDF